MWSIEGFFFSLSICFLALNSESPVAVLCLFLNKNFTLLWAFSTLQASSCLPGSQEELVKGRGIPRVTDRDAGSGPAGVLPSSDSRSGGFFPAPGTGSFHSLHPASDTLGSGRF